MNFFEARSKCVEDANKSLAAICVDDGQKSVALKAVNLILDSTIAERNGDEQSAKLLLNPALVVVSD